eukprot:jgi/Orpsp1_1/1186053/evm.model.c7180000096646.1
MKLLLFLNFIALLVASISGYVINYSKPQLLKETLNYSRTSDLDVYYHRSRNLNRPVVVHVHGGGWCE